MELIPASIADRRFLYRQIPQDPRCYSIVDTCRKKRAKTFLSEGKLICIVNFFTRIKLYRSLNVKLTCSLYRHFCLLWPLQAIILTFGVLCRVSWSGASKQTLSSVITIPFFVITNIWLSIGRGIQDSRTAYPEGCEYVPFAVGRMIHFFVETCTIWNQRFRIYNIHLVE